MKKLLFIAVMLLPLLMVSCGEDFIIPEEEQKPEELVVTEEASEVTTSTAILHGYIVPEYVVPEGVEVGFIISDSADPSVENGTVVVSAEIDDNNKFFAYADGLTASKTYYFRAYVKAGSYFMGDTKQFTTRDSETAVVDMGLSVHWADRNIGASAPEDYGDYYAWGEIETKENYTFETYKWSNGTETSLTKYNDSPSYGIVDDKMTLEEEDDVARVKFNGKFRIPTIDEFEELLSTRDNPDYQWEWKTESGNAGWKVTYLVGGSSLFIPAAGNRTGTTFELVGFGGNYWTSSLGAEEHSTPFMAWSVFFYDGGGRRSGDPRCVGFSIRPVVDNMDYIRVTSLSLSETDVELMDGETTEIKAVVLPENATRKDIKWTSSDESIATVENGVITAVSGGRAVIKAIADGQFASCQVTVISEVVDMGLSVKWRGWNVGAYAPEEYGDQYAWGETETKEDYTWSAYKWCDGTYYSLTKYNDNPSLGIVDNKSEMEPEDDVAHVVLGGSWRIPTSEEWTELLENCTWTWTSRNGVNGYWVTSDKNGGCIFLPAAGYNDGSGYYEAGNKGLYWSSSLEPDGSIGAWYVIFSSGYKSGGCYGERFRHIGQSIRPVGENLDYIPVTSISLSQTEVELHTGETIEIETVIMPENATRQRVTWKTSDEKVAKVVKGVIVAVAEGQALITATADGQSASCKLTVVPISSSYTEPEAVDMGLSVNWATLNIGAAVPEEYGRYFAWGETVFKDEYSWESYKWCNGTYNSLTKYNSIGFYGAVDNRSVLEAEDDAANVIFGGNWRMPTYSEWMELRDNCTITWTRQNGVYGNLVTSKKNGNSIFLPASGYREGTSIYDVGTSGYYWTSSLCEEYPDCAMRIFFYYPDLCPGGDSRRGGYSLRPVVDNSDYVPVTGINLSQTEIELHVGETAEIMAAILPENATRQSVKWESSQEDIAVVDNGIITAVFAGQATIIASADGVSASCKVTVVSDGSLVTESEIVDLGLSVKWRNRNIGASSPEEYGDYYAWGETETKDDYSEFTYKWWSTSSKIFTKYNTCSVYGPTDDKAELEADDDVARVKLGANWRMPTVAEFDELMKNCKWIMTTLNGVSGYVVVSNKNGNSIFLPAAGSWEGPSYDSVSLIGCYWSSSLCANDSYYSSYLLFVSDGMICRGLHRFYGLSIRPVTE